MNIRDNLGKSCLLATVIFWAIIGSESIDSNGIPLVFLSMIPIFFCVTTVIICSILPFFWLSRSGAFDNKIIFKTYFPYYAIVMFGLCFFGIISSGFTLYMTAFFTSAYITTCQSWVWFAKAKQK